ncbi:MAG: pyridoxal phosphate-dependent aminotransferase [Lachnospiraceae bacterium]|jgi:aspartate aminotransferase|nr:pyridoxal phosphate-dependent aminotransferase [Lachnospiraceae bacterium]MCH4063079.1 pyridoxal phosphate-dependent aminotransferase [Lachnospiraceae bacterium]MCH4104387.1 pyridoxal phosphate-dependent aminotransferase [Lachnospiraceae bacterium]MCI1310198.1 pyridoxal phosphate-dependent aminotransferase [Lachnospiraceae bacterium]MCI1334683.1 pyridoxal phosphate-dependent aminotransferase [Lachnospiraceae bacterium]
MISEKMKGFVAGSSAIRAMFEEGKKMASEYGADHVYDFSLGNPNVPAPQAVKDAILDITEHEDPVMLHGYMNNSGYEDVRQTIAEHLNNHFHTSFSAKNILMTVGAAGGLNVILKTLLNPGDEVVTISPYFGEYRSYVGNFDGVLVESPADPETFYPDFADLKKKITAKTKAMIINSPNNPTGVIYPESVIVELAQLLSEKESECGHPIYLISDEPYREIAFDGETVPWITGYYADSIVGSSFSKSLSLPGERIGYLVLPDSLDGAEDILAAANVANRILGFVNAPSLMQRVVARCIDVRSDVDFYLKNRDDLYLALIEDGYTVVHPDGAFYMWVKSPEEDERAFVDRLKKDEHILAVQGRSFGCKGWVRIAYCVAHETIEGALPGFQRVAEAYGL